MIKNASTLPKVFFGLHMVEGVAEYNEPSINNGQPYRILIGENTIKNMDASYAGKPVYVRHVEQVNLENLQEQADGYVVNSFFNKADGKHWAKFIVVSDKGHEAIRSGWKLSNAYIPKQFSGGGLWHGVEYAKEVMNAEYEHLAIVPNPRYEESIILTPEEFKEYNSKKEIELQKLANSKTKEKKSMFNLFKKTKVEDSSEFESMTVKLPKSGKEVSIAQLVNAADGEALKEQWGKAEKTDMHNEEMMDAGEKKEEMPKEEKHEEKKLADPEHHVQVGTDLMKINDLIAKHLKMCDDMKGMKKDDDSGEKEHEKEPAKKDDDSDKPGEDEDAKKKALELAEHEEKEIVEEKAKHNSSKHFLDLKDAPFMAYNEKPSLELSQDKTARGKSRYGSN